MQLLLRWVITAGALYATVWILKLLQLAAAAAEGPWYGWFLAVIVMGLVNALIRPIASLLTAPLNCLTFGIIGFLVNALMFWLVPVIMEGLGMPIFRIGFPGALLGSLLVGAIGGLLSNVLIREGEKDQ
jgi:putative membrane protein